MNEILLNMSGYAVKQLISTVFLKGIEEANWKTKLGQIDSLCSMALFAPNQVAVHLPEVINSIRAILLDTHPKVQEAGQQALNKILSAMRNQGKLNALAILEVHSEQIAKSSASENLRKSLDRLLNTTFSHCLDEPSLALLMPLIKDGLEAVNRDAQIKSLRILAYICSLTKWSSMIIPYLPEIAPIMVGLLLTIHPRLRSSSCKALAGFVKSLEPSTTIAFCKWICKQLRTAYMSDNKNLTFKYTKIDVEGTSTEQALYEELDAVKKMWLDESSTIRTSGVTLLVDFHRFVSCFRQTDGCKINMKEYVETVVPMFQNAILDSSEDVRAVAVKGMKLAIETFGDVYPNLLFRQILRGCQHGNYWIRYHTSVLTSTLLHILGGNIHKIKRDDSKGQKGKIDCYEDVISSIFILSYDMVERVSFTGSSAWQIFVEKRGGRFMVTPFTESPEALSNLINKIIDVLSSDYHEVHNAGVRALSSLVGKTFDKLMEVSLDLIDGSFENIDDATSHKIFTYFHHLIDCCDESVSKFRKRIENTLGRMIIHQNKDVREMSSGVFKLFNKALGDENFVKDFIKDNFCNYENKEDHNLLDSKMIFLRALMEDPYLMVSPILTSIILTPKENVESEYLNRAKLLRLVIKYCQGFIMSSKKQIADPAKMLTLILRLILEGRALFEIEEISQYIANDTYVTMGNSKEVINELTQALVPLVLMIPNEKIYEWQEQVEDMYKSCTEKKKMKVYFTFITHFIHHPKYQSDSYVEIYVRNICKHINTDDEELLDILIECIESGEKLDADADIIAENLSKDWQYSFVTVFRHEAEDLLGIDEEDESFDNDKIAILENERGVQIISKILINGLLNGKQNVRTDAAYSIGLVAKFAPLSCFKKYVIKMAGGLIRIVNDKFEDELKITIFRALRRLFEKAGVAMKPMCSPLKTTFSQFSKQKDLSEEIKQEIVKLQEVMNDSLAKKKSK